MTEIELMLVLLLILAAVVLAIGLVLNLHRRVKRLEGDAVAEFGAEWLADLEGACKEIDERREKRN